MLEFPTFHILSFANGIRSRIKSKICFRIQCCPCVVYLFICYLSTKNIKVFVENVALTWKNDKCWGQQFVPALLRGNTRSEVIRGPTFSVLLTYCTKCYSTSWAIMKEFQRSPTYSTGFCNNFSCFRCQKRKFREVFAINESGNFVHRRRPLFPFHSRCVWIWMCIEKEWTMSMFVKSYRYQESFHANLFWNVAKL